jgi:signal transduction histidine kinase
MNREKLVAFLDQHAAILVFELDEQGQILKVNNYTRRFLGEDPAGRKIEDVFLDFHKDFAFAEWLKSDADKRLLNLPRPDGLPQTFHMHLLRSGSSYTLIGEVNSEEVEDLRMELVRSNNQLHNLTRELHKKKSELEQLNEVKNHFLGVAAHDLRNPLGAIMNYSEYMLSEGESFSGEHLEFLSNIRYLSEFMLSLLDDLLDISALESGKLEPMNEPGIFDDFIEQVVSVNRPFAKQKEIDLVLDSQLPREISLFDEHRLRQVLNNLISNAIKFSSPKTRVTIEAYKKDSSLFVQVKDQGPGIPQEEQGRLFSAFPKISVRSTGGERSTGLGLAITKKIVSSLKGKIWAESTVGKGSTFFCQLPWLIIEEEL